MASVAEGLKSQLRNIESQYGKSIDAWMKLIKKSGKRKHGEIVAMLKSTHGMAHGAAHRLALVALAGGEDTKKAKQTQATNPIDSVYADAKAAFRPLHEKIMSSLNALGSDIEVAEKKGYISLRRRKQFAMLQPGARWLNVGLVLKNVKPTDRLESAATFNALFTHRVRVSSLEEIDQELTSWLAKAYREAE